MPRALHSHLRFQRRAGLPCTKPPPERVRTALHRMRARVVPPPPPLRPLVSSSVTAGRPSPLTVCLRASFGLGRSQYLRRHHLAAAMTARQLLGRLQHTVRMYEDLRHATDAALLQKFEASLGDAFALLGAEASAPAPPPAPPIPPSAPPLAAPLPPPPVAAPPPRTAPLPLPPTSTNVRLREAPREDFGFASVSRGPLS